MLAVEKWAQGKNESRHLLFSLLIALMAKMQCDALGNLKDCSIFGHPFSPPDLPSWFVLYPSREPLFAYKRLISHSSEFVDQQIYVMTELRKLDKALKKDPNTVIQY